MRRSGFFLVAGALAAFAPRAAHAGPSCDKGAVLKLVQDANAAFGAQHFADAVTAYEAAYACNHDASLLFNVAKADQELGRFVEALDAMRRFEKESRDLSKDVRAAADDVIAQLSTHVGTLTVHSSEPGAKVTAGDRDLGTTPIDGVEIAEGTVRVRVELAGRDPIVRQVEVKGGKAAKVDADFSPATEAAPTPAPTPPPPSGPTIHPLVWTGVAVGGAGLIIAIGTGAASLVQTNDIKTQCNGNVCPASTEPARSKANTLANVSNAMYGVAGVGAILGVVGAVLTVKSSKPAAVALGVGPSGVELRGAF